MITSTTKPRAGAVIAAMALLLSGCAVAPD